MYFVGGLPYTNFPFDYLYKNKKSGQIALPAQMIIKDMNYSLIIDICDNNALDIKGLGCTARFSDSYNNLS